jgi:hypothetical protein
MPEIIEVELEPCSKEHLSTRKEAHQQTQLHVSIGHIIK